MDQLDGSGHSDLISAALMISLYLLISCATNAVNCEIDKAETCAPSFSSRNLISGSVRTLLISALSRAASSGGAPRGAKNPTHKVKSKFAIPVASATVGMSGAVGARVPAETASNLTLPPCIKGTAAGKPGK